MPPGRITVGLMPDAALVRRFVSALERYFVNSSAEIGNDYGDQQDQGADEFPVHAATLPGRFLDTPKPR